jgi:hypothetical protein
MEEGRTERKHMHDMHMKISPTYLSLLWKDVLENYTALAEPCWQYDTVQPQKNAYAHPDSHRAQA